MADYTKRHFQKEWARDENLDPDDLYPWQPDPTQPTQPPLMDSFHLTKPTSQPKHLLAYVFREHTFNETLASLRNGKSPGPDGVPNELIRMMPDSFKRSLRHLFIIMWLTNTTPHMENLRHKPPS